VNALPSEGMLLAVGLPKGITLPASGVELPPTGWVHAGGRQRPLSPDEYQVWTFALVPRLRRQLIDLAQGANVVEAESIVSDMVDAGVLMEVRATDRAAELSDVRLLPIAIGAGNDPTRLDVWQVFDPSREMTLELDAVSFGIWSEIDGSATLADVCRAVAETFVGVEEDAVWSRVPRLLVNLMALRYVFVDGPVNDAAFD